MRTETLCVHCGIMRDEKFCNADPYINSEPRTYCSLANSPRSMDHVQWAVTNGSDIEPLRHEWKISL